MGKHDRISNVEVPHVQKICLRCHSPYMIIFGSDHAQTCPYCSNEFYINDIVDLKKTNASLRKEIAAAKRSNAALRGVVTKMRGGMGITSQPDIVIKAINKSGREIKQFELVSAELVKADPYEVDLCDLNNYIVKESRFSACSECDYSKFSSCKSGIECLRKIKHKTLKLKPEIKADLESGKAVAKGGKR